MEEEIIKERKKIAEDLNKFSRRYPEFGVRMIVLEDGTYIFNTCSFEQSVGIEE